MKMPIRIPFFAVLLSVGGISCATLTPEGSRVRVIEDPAEVQSCTKVGKVRAESSMSNDAGWTAIGNRNSSVKIRNIAAEEGGDTLLMVKDQAGLFGSKREGIIYRCELSKDGGSIEAR